MDADSKKKAAALAALEYVEDGMTVGSAPARQSIISSRH